MRWVQGTHLEEKRGAIRVSYAKPCMKSSKRERVRGGAFDVCPSD